MTPAQAQLAQLYEDLTDAQETWSLTDDYDLEQHLATYITSTQDAIAAMEQAGVQLPEEEPTLPADLEAFTAWAIGQAQGRVELNLRLYDVWLLFSCVQLSTTHPQVSPALTEELHRLGDRLEALLAAMAPPAIAALARAGWDRSADVPEGEGGEAAHQQAIR